MSKIMARDADGEKYVKIRTIGDVTVTVIDFEKEHVGEPPVTWWTTANIEVKAGDQAVNIVRRRNGTYDVPTAGPGAQRLTIKQAIAVALGRENPPAPREHRGSGRGRPAGTQEATDESSQLAAALRASVRATAAQTEVINEPEANWALKEGDRIMRHLTLYPEGVDAQTMSAGMHDLATNKIRTHLRRMAKAATSPVREVRTGIYTRATA